MVCHGFYYDWIEKRHPGANSDAKALPVLSHSLLSSSGHVDNFDKSFEKENFENIPPPPPHVPRAFTFQNMCFPITDIGKHVFWNIFCTGSGRRTPTLKFVKKSYGFVGPPVANSSRVSILVSGPI